MAADPVPQPGPRRRWGRAATALFVVVATLAATGCGSDPPTLDAAKTDAAVAGAVRKATGIAPEGTDCPGEVVRAAGRSFRCRLDLGDAGPLVVSVRQSDDQGHLEVVPRAAVLDDAVLADRVAVALGRRFGRTFRVDCGDAGPTVRPVGTSVVCDARDDDGARQVQVVITDAAGTLEVTVLAER